MRLINAYDLHFEEFYDSDIPTYAILSHRWGDEEVSFKEMRKSNGGEGRKGKGWEKIRSTCKLAKSEMFRWVWVDTCCINKDSSAELTEAINSMFKWYAQSGRCYVYLSDISWSDRIRTSGSPIQAEELGRSSWFSRGWTLQELLAPRSICFYDKDWSRIGLKHDMTPLLADITNITPYHLSYGRWHRACVAQKMSWASGRQTSRVEDMAYSLLGLFDVNMPLLYGEGRKAFYRLQLEIVKQSDDESIFAWITKGETITHTGMLAPWPDAFRDSRNVTFLGMNERSPFAMTNKGLEMGVPARYTGKHSNGSVIEYPNDLEGGILILRLNCSTVHMATGRVVPVIIMLERLGICWYRKAQYISTNFFDKLVMEKGKFLSEYGGIKVYVRQEEISRLR